MIVTWLADVSALHENTTYRKYYEQLPDFRKEKADKLRMQEDKALSVGAWILLEKIRKEYHLQENILYNISHSGDFALCTVRLDGTSEQLGCDLEKRGRRSKESCMALAKRFFCQEECALIQTEDDFYRFWVLKESFQKATRLGSKLAMNTFSFTFLKEGTPMLRKQPFEKEYYFKEYVVENLPYRIAVCSDANEFSAELGIVKL